MAHRGLRGFAGAIWKRLGLGRGDQSSATTAGTPPNVTTLAGSITTPACSKMDSKDFLNATESELSFKMLYEKAFSPSVMLWKFISIRKGVYNNIFYDEMYLPDNSYSPNNQKREKCCGYFLHKLSKETMNNIWIAFQKESSNSYLSKFKRQSNFSQFKATFYHPELNVNLRNPADIQQHSISNLVPDKLKKAQAIKPPNIITGIPPRILELANPEDQTELCRVLTTVIDTYFTKQNNTENIMLMLPSNYGAIPQNTLKNVLQKLLMTFPNINFFGYAYDCMYGPLFKEIEEELKSGPGASSSSTSTITQSKNNICLDVNAYLNQKERAILITDALMMEGNESPAIISLFAEMYATFEVSNVTETNYSCRCTANLTVIRKRYIK